MTKMAEYGCWNCGKCKGWADEDYGMGEYICEDDLCEDIGIDKKPTGWVKIDKG